LSNCSAALDSVRHAPFHVHVVRREAAMQNGSAIKRPKDMCACAIFAYILVSARRDLEFGSLALEVGKLCARAVIRRNNLDCWPVSRSEVERSIEKMP
jgi:hypothetical protein